MVKQFALASHLRLEFVVRSFVRSSERAADFATFRGTRSSSDARCVPKRNTARLQRLRTFLQVFSTVVKPGDGFDDLKLTRVHVHGFDRVNRGKTRTRSVPRRLRRHSLAHFPRPLLKYTGASESFDRGRSCRDRSRGTRVTAGGGSRGGQTRCRSGGRKPERD